ncbi:MAG: alpha/beta hydrolase [Oscillospiraceae bacterium]|jgi:hypothetical protein|nr:alpha/beta hydrolase [Oscillospiraceae bacterium]
MKQFTKRFVSMMLVAVMLCCISVSSSAAKHNASSCKLTPIIEVGGIGDALYSDYGTENEKRYAVTSPDMDALMSKLLEILTKVAWGFIDTSSAVDGLKLLAETLFGAYAMDDKGKSILPISAKPNEDPDTRDHTKGDKYRFTYDWRLDFSTNAVRLNTFINQVLRSTGHSKVSIMAHSEGGSIVTAYLAKYGSAKLENVVLLTVASGGVSMVDKLLTKQVNFDANTALAFLTNLVAGMMRGEWTSIPVQGLIYGVHYSGILPLLCWILNGLVAAAGEELFDEVLIPLFCKWPVLWCFISTEEAYVQAKKILLDPVKNKEFIKTVDKVHYNVTMRSKELFAMARDNGVKISVIAAYGLPQMPVVTDSMTSSDALIDTSLESLGGTVADVGKTVGAQRKDLKHNHISPNKQVDASTCLFPESTWFIRDHMHFKWPPDSFLDYLLTSKKQPTITSNTSYPQFLTYDADGNLIADS